MAMKMKLGMMVLAATMAAPAMSMMAQEPSAPPPPLPGAGGRGGQMMHMYDSLNLTPEQRSVFTDTAREQRDKMKALRDDNSMDPKDKRQQMMHIREDGVAKMRAVLTEDQKPRFDEIQKQMREQMRERMQERRDGSGETAPPPPPPPSN